MSNKEELAALMASDGDYERKISLLKKAVVTVTKQKQEMESRHAQLQEELRTTAQQLSEAQRENGVLQRRVKALETQQQEHERGSGGSAFGQNMLKGLSSIMGNNDATGRGGGGRGGGVGGRGHGGSAGPKLTLSAEDVERLVTENEQLHREKYTYKTKLEDAQRAGAKDAEGLKAEVAQLQKELMELHGTLDIATSECGRLNAAYLTERAVGDFCRHFFVVALSQKCGEGDGALPVAAELQWPAAQRRQSPSSPSSSPASMPAEVREEVARSLQSCSGTMKTLLRGISVLLIVLREQLPRRERATVGDLECLRDRLSVFLDAHTMKKDRLMHLLEELDGFLTNAVASGGTSSCVSFVKAQDAVLQLLIEWVGLLRAQMPLLVESCVSYLPQGHTFTLRTGRGGAASLTNTSLRTTTNRGEFVEEVTKHGYAALASVEGSLKAVRMLIESSPMAYRSSVLRHNDGLENSAEEADGAGGADAGRGACLVDLGSLLALQQFWWEGCTSVRALHASACALDLGLQDLAEGCDKSEIRGALNYLGKCLRSLVVASAAPPSPGAAGRDADAAIAAVRPSPFAPGQDGVAGAAVSMQVASYRSRPVPGSPAPSRAPPHSPASVEAYEEVLVALAAADRAAAAYYTQMNYLYMEMADREDALQTATEAAQQMKGLLEMERTEAEHTRKTMQAQISVLSNQLIEAVDAAPAQPPQHQR